MENEEKSAPETPDRRINGTMTLFRYLLNNYVGAFGGCEWHLWHFFLFMEKHDLARSEKMRARFRQLADESRERALSIDPEADQILAGGWQAFAGHIAGSFLERYRYRIFLNYCERCGELTRTPRARLCLNCGHSWYDRPPGPPPT